MKKSRKKITLIVCAVFILIIAFYGAGGFIIDSVKDNAYQQAQYAIQRHEYSLALRQYKTSNNLRKAGFLWGMSDDSSISDAVALLEGIIAKDSRMIMAEIDRQLQSGSKAANIWGDWRTLMGNRIIERNYYGSIKGYHRVAVTEVFPLIPCCHSVWEKLNPMSPDKVTLGVWSYVSEESLNGAFAGNPCGKILACTVSDQEDTTLWKNMDIKRINLAATMLLPPQYLPQELSEVEYLILFNIREGRRLGVWKSTASGSTSPAVQLCADVWLVNASNMEPIKNFGVIWGDEAASIAANASPGEPAGEEIIAVMGKITEYLETGDLNSQ